MSYISSSYKYGWRSVSIFFNYIGWHNSLQAISGVAGKIPTLQYYNSKIRLFKARNHFNIFVPVLNISTMAFSKMMNFVFNIDTSFS